MSNNKDSNKTFDKLKQFFRINKGTAATNLSEWPLTTVLVGVRSSPWRPTADRTPRTCCPTATTVVATSLLTHRLLRPACVFTGALCAKEDYTLTVEQSLNISPESSIHCRIKAIMEFADVARSHRLEEVTSLCVGTMVFFFFPMRSKSNVFRVLFYCNDTNTASKILCWYRV